MIRIFSKKLLGILISTAVAGTGIIWACADGGWDEYGVSSFAPEAFVAREYSPFFYSDQFYYGIGHDTRHIYRFNEEIVSDWNAYLQLPMPDTGLSYLLLRASKGMVDSVAKGLEVSMPGVPSSDPVLVKRKEPKVAAFYRFLSLAKYNESYAAVQWNYWDYDEAKKDSVSPAAGISAQQLEQEFKGAKDDFLKQRYWFQLLRSYFFAGAYDQCIASYDQYKTTFKANTLSVRAMAYAAGAYYKKKDYAHANYLFSRVYDAGAELKTVAHFSFQPQQETDWQQTLQLCRNKEEQATLWQLLGIYHDGPRAIKEIYALDPHNAKLELLLSRLVNIEENRMSGNTDYNNKIRHKAKDSTGKSLLDLVGGIAAAGNTSQPYMWYLAEGYLHFLYEEYKPAEQCYAKAAKTLPSKPLLQAQARLLLFINRVGAAKKVDAATEQLLLPDLKWMQELSTGKLELTDLRFSTSYEWAKQNLANRYRAQKSWLKAECFEHRDTFYTIPDRVVAMKQFLSQASVSPFEQYCRDIYPINASDISEYQAIQLVMKDQLDQALSLMDEASGQSTELPGNPFNGRIRDCHDCDHEAPQKVKYTKLSLLQKLKEMKALAAAGTDAYSNYLLLGNAFYNITYYGNARAFYDSKVINGDYYSMFLSSSFDAMLTDCSLPMSYYRKALAAAQTAEQKAKCTFMIVKCEQNQRYNREKAAGRMEDYGYSYFGPMDFKAFQAYKNTAYYQDVIRECGYFRTYLGMK